MGRHAGEPTPITPPHLLAEPAPQPVAPGFDFFAAAPVGSAPAPPVAPAAKPDPPLSRVVPPPPWAPSPWAGPPVQPPVVAPLVDEDSESGLAVGPAMAVTVVALVLSGIYQLSAHLFIHRGDVFDVSLRRALVYTLGFYILIGLALLAFVHVKRVRLVWHRGGVPGALLLGLPLGAVGGLLGVAVSSAASGHLASDPNVTALVGGGGFARVLIALVTTAVLAPLVEETIFRGICAGTLINRGVAAAVWVSAIAFAIWHCNPSALRYYAVMGLVFAGIWRKRGLLASMSAHAAFNGVLTIAAVLATSGVGSATTFDGISLFVPGGWHVDDARSGPNLQLVVGPSGSGLLLMAKPQSPDEQSLAQLETRVSSTPVQSGVSIDPGSMREVSSSLGTVLTADFTVERQPGHVLAFPYNGSIYEVVMVTAGNPAAEHEWSSVVESLRPA